MSFKSEAANVRGKIAAGTFKKAAPSPFKGFFEQVSAGLIRSDEAKRLEDIATRKENKRIAREVKAKQDIADAKAKKIETNAVRLANQFAGSDAGSNAKVIDYFRQNLIATDNDYNGTVTATTGLIDSNRLAFLPQELYSEIVSTSGAALNKPPAMRPDNTVTLPEEFTYQTTTYNYETQSYDGKSRPIDARDLKRYATYDGDDETKREAKVLAQQMIDLGLSDERQEALYGDTSTTEVPVYGETEVKLEPYKKPRYDTSDLRKENWKGRYQSIVNNSLKGDKDQDALDIQAWAVGQKFFPVAAGLTKAELLAMPITGDGTIVGLTTVLGTSVLNADETTIINDIIVVKKAEEEDSTIYNDVDKLILKSVSDLSAFAAIYEKTTEYGKNIRIALTRKEALASADNLQALSRELGKDVNWYDQAIEIQGVLDLADPYYDRNVASLKSLLILRGLAVEKLNADDISADQKLTAKERFLKASIEEKGSITVGEDGSNSLGGEPLSIAMGAIEASWKRLTDITEKSNWYEDDKLLQLNQNDLKVIIDTGLLTEQPDVLKLVEDMYESRVQIAKDTKLSKILDPTGKTFNSTTELDAYLAALGPEVLEDPTNGAESLKSFTRVRAVLARAEGLIAKGKPLEPFQLSLEEYLLLPENKGKKGQEFIDVMTNFQTYWKDNTAATPDNPLLTTKWNSSNELNTYMAQLGKDGTTPAITEDYVRILEELKRQEGVATAEKDITGKQKAFTVHMTLDGNAAKFGQALIDEYANFEKLWKDNSAAPTFNTEYVAGEIFKANQLLSSTDPTKKAEGQAFLDNTLPNMIKGLVGVNNTTLNQEAQLQFLLRSGVDEAFARATVGGTVQIVADPITGNKTPVNFSSFSDAAPAEIQTQVAGIASNITQLGETGFQTIVDGEEITVSRQDLLESQDFMNREKNPGGNLDIRKAFGSSAFVKWAASNTTALIGWETFPELIQMQTYIKGLNNAAMRSISVAIEGSRDSVMNKNLILDTLPKASTLFESRTAAKQKLKGTVGELKRQMEVLQGTLDGRTTPTAKSKAFIQLNALKPLYNSYNTLLLAWSEAESGASVSVSPGMKLTETVTVDEQASVETQFWSVTEEMIEKHPHMDKYRNKKIRIVNGVVEVEGE